MITIAIGLVVAYVVFQIVAVALCGAWAVLHSMFGK